MQENNFENEVRKRLDELSLTPSEPVWQNVEAAIRKKRERRLVFWLLPLLLLMSGVAWWQLASWQNKEVALQQTTKTNKAQQTFSKPHTTPSLEKAGTNAGTPKDRNSIQSNIKTKAGALYVEPDQRNNTNANPVTEQPRVKKNQKQKEITAAIAKKSETAAAKNRFVKQQATKAADANTEASVAVPVRPTSPSESTKVAIASLDSTPERAHTAGIDSSKKLIPQPKKTNQPKHKLQWSIVSRVGSSNMVEPVWDGMGMKSMSESNQQLDYSSGGPGPNYDSSVSRPPSGTEKGLHYAIGAIVKRSVGKQSFLITGLQYTFYRNHLTVGTEMPADSLNQVLYGNALAVRNAFRNDGTYNDFTNTFYFIELPVGFEYALLKNYPLHVQHGFTIGQLIGSKVLQYDGETDSYFQSKEGLRKTVFSVYTSIDYTVWKRNAISLQAGPHVQYSLQSVAQNNSNGHLFSGGLAVNLSF